ncbi:Hypothetical predicted protein [Lecanosticta acicola]|uniref:Uncharacterized protein n=1 Tax=Lecanosticta acicola TaxID=111012 RepID=A0AAI8Z5X6_9PEZI|nr:Hypothetical predicted protein [Lecanosticta acicola]
MSIFLFLVAGLSYWLAESARQHAVQKSQRLEEARSQHPDLAPNLNRWSDLDAATCSSQQLLQHLDQLHHQQFPEPHRVRPGGNDSLTHIERLLFYLPHRLADWLIRPPLRHVPRALGRAHHAPIWAVLDQLLEPPVSAFLRTHERPGFRTSTTYIEDEAEEGGRREEEAEQQDVWQDQEEDIVSWTPYARLVARAQRLKQQLEHVRECSPTNLLACLVRFQLILDPLVPILEEGRKLCNDTATRLTNILPLVSSLDHRISVSQEEILRLRPLVRSAAPDVATNLTSILLLHLITGTVNVELGSLRDALSAHVNTHNDLIAFLDDQPARLPSSKRLDFLSTQLTLYLDDFLTTLELDMRALATHAGRTFLCTWAWEHLRQKEECLFPKQIHQLKGDLDRTFHGWWNGEEEGEDDEVEVFRQVRMLENVDWILTTDQVEQRIVGSREDLEVETEILERAVRVDGWESVFGGNRLRCQRFIAEAEGKGKAEKTGRD